MNHLPTPPGCGQPATVRLEVASPPSDAHPYGVLEAIIYACEEHAPGHIQTAKDAGLLCYPVKLVPGRVCGYVVVFGGDR